VLKYVVPFAPTRMKKHSCKLSMPLLTNLVHIVFLFCFPTIIVIYGMKITNMVDGSNWNILYIEWSELKCINTNSFVDHIKHTLKPFTTANQMVK
jgi:hypothetical protein